MKIIFKNLFQMKRERVLTVSILTLAFALVGYSAFAALTFTATTTTTDGNYTLDGVAGSAYSIGASTTTGTITIGGTAQTGAIKVGESTAALTLSLGTGNGAKTVNIANGTGIDTINIGTGGTGVDVIRIGDSAADLALTDANWSIATSGAIATASSVLSSSASAGIGYATGAGCAVTQITNRTTGVTCTGVSGAITTNTASLAAEGTADFVVTNTSVAIGDTVVVSMRSGSNSGGTLINVAGVAAGSFTIRVHNGNVAAGTAETGAIIINFAVIKAVSS